MNDNEILYHYTTIEGKLLMYFGKHWIKNRRYWKFSMANRCSAISTPYQLVKLGWQDERRIYGCSVHIDIKDGKIWLQHNVTDRRVAHELVELGVAKEDIVLGFQPPYKRQL